MPSNRNGFKFWARRNTEFISWEYELFCTKLSCCLCFKLAYIKEGLPAGTILYHRPFLFETVFHRAGSLVVHTLIKSCAVQFVIVFMLSSLLFEWKPSRMRLLSSTSSFKLRGLRKFSWFLSNGRGNVTVTGALTLCIFHVFFKVVRDEIKKIERSEKHWLLSIRPVPVFASSQTKKCHLQCIMKQTLSLPNV